MFLYKFNVFHWHLTDDEGWRLEIQALPNLTQQGAWRGRGHVIEPQYGGDPRRRLQRAGACWCVKQQMGCLGLDLCRVGAR